MFRKLISLITASTLLVTMLGITSVSEATADSQTQAYDWGRAKVVGGGKLQELSL